MLYVPIHAATDVKAGATESFRYRAPVPMCMTWYVVHAQLKDTRLIQGTDQVSFPVTWAPPAAPESN